MSRNAARQLKNNGASSPSPSPTVGLNKTMKLPMISSSPTFNNSALEDHPLLSHSPSSKTSLSSGNGSLGIAANGTGNAHAGVGVCSMQGRRPYQEDEFALHPHLTGPFSSMPSLPETHFFGLFDGHAGGRCSQHVSQSLAHTLIEDEAYSTNLPQAIKRAFHTCNEQFLKVADKLKLHDGSTGCVALIRDNKILVANSGDCRAVVVSGSRVIQMSTDHKPTHPDEQKRINSLGGSVVYCMGVARVNRVLAVSRAFGNRTLRTVIRPDAELMQRDISETDEYLVIGSDGLWDVLKNKEIGDVCYSNVMGLSNMGGSSGYMSSANGVRVGGGGGISQRIAEELVQMALARGSMDNVTCIVVYLPDFRGRGGMSMGIGMGAGDGGDSRNSLSSISSLQDEGDGHVGAFKKMNKGSSNNLLYDIHKGGHSMGAAEFADMMRQSYSPSPTVASNPTPLPLSPSLPPRNPLLKASTAPPNLLLQHKVYSSGDEESGDDNNTIIDFSPSDRPITALDPLPRVTNSRGGMGLGGIAMSTNNVNNASAGKTVSEVVGTQKASFPAHIRSLRSHGISSSFNEGTSTGPLSALNTTNGSNNNGGIGIGSTPPRLQNRPLSLTSSWMAEGGGLGEGTGMAMSSSLPPRSRGNSLSGGHGAAPLSSTWGP
eukprot:gene24032-29081_t